MQNGLPVETVCGCAPLSRSDSARPRTPATSERSCRSPKTASFCHIVAKTPLLGVGSGLETNGDCPDIKQELKFTGTDQRRMVKVQPTGRSKRGVAGEGQLFLRGEDADTHALL